MKLLLTLLLGLFWVSRGAAQPPLPKTFQDSLGTRDTMPTLRDRGTAMDMPTRKDRGDVVDMPTHRVGLMPGKEVEIPKSALENLKRYRADSTKRTSPNDSLAPAKKPKP